MGLRWEGSGEVSPHLLGVPLVILCQLTSEGALETHFHSNWTWPFEVTVTQPLFKYSFLMRCQFIAFVDQCLDFVWEKEREKAQR